MRATSSEDSVASNSSATVAGSSTIWVNQNGSHWRGSKGFIVFVVLLGVLTDMTVYSIFMPILPFIVADVGGDSVQTSALLMVYAIGNVVSSPFFGWVADRYKHKRLLMVGGLFSMAGGLLLMAFVRSYWVLIMMRFFQGVSAGAVWSLGLALVADTYHGEQSGLGQAVGWVMTGYTVGTVIGPSIGGALFGWSYYAPFVFCLSLISMDLIARFLVIEPEWEETMTVTSSSSVCCPDTKSVGELPFNNNCSNDSIESVMTTTQNNSGLFLLPDKNGSLSASTVMDGRKKSDVSVATSISKQTADDEESNSSQTLRINSANGSSNDIKQTTSSKPWGFYDVFKCKPLLRLLLLVVAAGSEGREVTLPEWLADVYGLTPSQVGLVFFAIIIPNLIFQSVGGIMHDRYGMQPFASVCFTLMAASNVLPGITIYSADGNPSLIWLCAALFIVSTFFALGLSPMVTEIAECVPREAYSMGYSLFNMSWSTGIVIGPLLGAIVYEHYGWLYQNVFFSLCICLALPAIYTYRRPLSR